MPLLPWSKHPHDVTNTIENERKQIDMWLVKGRKEEKWQGWDGTEKIKKTGLYGLKITSSRIVSRYYLIQVTWGITLLQLSAAKSANALLSWFARHIFTQYDHEEV